MGMPWGSIAGTILGTVTGQPWMAAAGGMFDTASSGSGTPAGGSSQAGVGPSGAWSVAPQYPWAQDTNKAASTYSQGVFDAANKGEIPPWLKAALATISGQQHSATDALYKGTPGQRSGSVINMAGAAGAAMGTGAKASYNLVNKALTRYEQASQQIDAEIAQKQIDYTSTSIGQALYGAIALPQGPNSQFVTNQGYAGSSTPGVAPYLGSMAESAGYSAQGTGGVDWLGMAGNATNYLMNSFGAQKKPTVTSATA